MNDQASRIGDPTSDIQHPTSASRHPLIEWDTFDFRVSGERLNALARSMVAPPIEKIELRFGNGLLRVEGSLRKFISVPFHAEITAMHPSGVTVRVPVRSAAAFGGVIPIPQFLFRFTKDRLPADVIRFEEPATFVVLLDRFLPSFVNAEIQRIWIIEGGLAVTLGRGGADLPVNIFAEGSHDG